MLYIYIYVIYMLLYIYRYISLFDIFIYLQFLDLVVIELRVFNVNTEQMYYQIRKTSN